MVPRMALRGRVLVGSVTMNLFMPSASRWGAVLVVAALVACKTPKVGDPCASTGDNRCTGTEAALLCIDGKLAAATCGGGGCQASPFACDYREAAKGAACFERASPATPMACSANKKARVRCVKGVVDRDECDGPRGCYPKSETTMGCDRALRAGAPCGSDGDWCADGASEWLQCKGGKLEVAARCRGPAGCKPFADTIACDTSIGAEGDPCIGNAEACSVDKRAVLRCQGGQLRVATTCASAKSCDPAHPGCT